MTGYLLIDQDSGELIEACQSHSYDAEKRAKEILEAGDAEAICIAAIQSVIAKEVSVRINTDRYPALNELPFFANLLPTQEGIEPAPIPETPPSQGFEPAAAAEALVLSADDDLPL